MPSGIPKEQLEDELREFGAKLRRERLRAEMTQERLAERAQIAVRSLQKIEAGQINILLTTARRLRRALGCDWDDLTD